MGTIRGECPDWTLVWNQRQLYRVLTEYLRHYNSARPHRSLDLRPPRPAPRLALVGSNSVEIPDAYRHGTPILIRSDSAGCTQGLLAHIRSLHEDGVDTRFSVGVAITEEVREAIVKVKRWIPAIGADGDLRDGAQIAEITGLVPDSGYPEGTRFIVRRKIPHPGAQ